MGVVFVAAILSIGFGMPATAQEQQPAQRQAQQPAGTNQQQQAQQPQQQPEQQPVTEEEFKEEVTVTGTLIPRPTLDAMSPVSTLEIEELTYRGMSRMEDLLTSLPQIFASQNAIVANGSSGTATVNLRNLGEVRTMVLIDGRRMPSGDYFSPGYDLNFIPAALVKRVDILTGGASSVYGADAVAGVVNFVMDRDFEGVRGGIQFAGFQHNNDNSEAQAINAARGYQTATGDTWDGNTFNANIALGGKFADGKGHGVIYIDYRDAKALLKAARDYTNCSVNTVSASGPRCGGSGTSDLGTFDVYRPDDTLFGNYKVNPDGTHTWIPRAGYVWNFAPYNYLQRPEERWVAGGYLNYDFSEQLEGYLEVGFMNDRTDAQIAPSGNFFNTFQLNVDNPMLSDQQRQILLDAGWGPHDVATVNIGRRNVEGGGRLNQLSHNAWRMVGGLKGDLGQAWSYDVSGLLTEVSAPNSYRNDFNIFNIQDSLLVDGDPDDPSTWVCRSGNPNCSPWNIFRTGAVTQAAIDYLDIALLYDSGTSTRLVTGKVTGDLGEYGFTIPSATEGIQFAFGADYGEFATYYRPDQASQNGIAAGQGAATPAVEGGYNVTEMFVEALIPIVQGAAFAKDLSLELGYRYSDYSTSGDWPTYKAQASWAPGGGLKFRAGFNRATRSANVRELFVPQGLALGGSTDPCAGANPAATFEQCARTGVTAAQYGNIQPNAAGQYNTLTGGNPNLDPEVADTISYGMVFTPVGSSFTGALDYYRVEVNDTIGSLLADDIINNCIETGNPVLCSLIHRDRFGSLWIVQGQAYTETTNQNIGKLISEGVDLNLSYVLPTGNSFFTFNLVGTYLLSNTKDTGLYSYDCVGYFGDICNNFYGPSYGLTPDWRHLARVSWEIGPTVLSLGWRMLSEMTHESASPDEGLSDPDSRETWEALGSYTIPATHYFDLAFNYKIAQGLQLTFGVNNILDKDPPLGAGIDNIDYGPGFWGAYDVYGRYIHSSIQFQF
jgi:outer membrane receptor protein involved in Fe transport